MAVKILSEPDAETPPKKGGIRIISEPKEPDYAPPGGFGERLKSNYMRDINEGVDRMGQPGVFNKAMGALGYAFAPLNAAGKTIAGDPAAMLTRDLGGGPAAQRMVGETANIGSQVFGGAPFVKATQAAVPAMEKAVTAVLARLKDGSAMNVVNKGATAAGGVMRGTVDAVEDVVKQRVAAGERSAAEAAANAPPKAETLYTQAGDAYKAAEAKGGTLEPGRFQTKVGSLRDTLEQQGISASNDPELFKNTGAMLTALEKRAEGGVVNTFGDLVKLQRALRGYVRQAKAAGAKGTNDDLRGTMILKNEIDSLISESPDAAGLLGEGKELYKRASKMDDIDDIMTKAERLNDPDMLQREFRELALDDYAMKTYTAAERALIDKIAATSRVEDLVEGVTGGAGKVGKIKSAVSAARGANDSRMKLARELKDLVARGEAAQKAAAAEKAAQPSFGERINKMLRPGPPNSANRGFPYSD